ncbi:MAG: exodeoxyribonuclease III [Zetaproteobacteria bacterium]|nr:exodeoxyribonuclease III [Zetaproteobacteria bacterium]
MQTTLVSWNVNGLRAVIRKQNWQPFLQQLDADLICIQETKASEEQLTTDFAPGYQAFWHAAEKKGYSGTLILSRKTPLRVHTGLDDPELDREGRVVTAEFGHFHLVNVYTPNAQNELRRLEYRAQVWDPAFRRYVCALEAVKPVIMCGDFNVAHQAIDIARPKANERSPGYTLEERQGFSNLLQPHFDDSFRLFCSDPGQYSWWSYRARAREKNIGWRIDYVCTSKQLRDQLVSAQIHPEIYGSDHCPVSATFQNL